MNRRQPKEWPSAGALLLRLKFASLTHTGIAKELFSARSSVTRWLSGRSIPSDEARAYLERYCDIPASAWFLPASAARRRLRV